MKTTMLQRVRERLQGRPAEAQDAGAGRARENQGGGHRPSPTDLAGVAPDQPATAGFVATDEEVEALFAKFGRV